MSTDLRAAARQALEALESLFTLQADDARPQRCGDAIAALRAALEQPEHDRPTIEQMMAVIGENQRLREWRGLEDYEIDIETAESRDSLMDFVYEHGTVSEGQQRFIRKIARAIEAALKERNA
jgi:hypothetical protein